MNLTELITALKDKQVEVTFKKKNGELRNMLCTLSESIIGQDDQTKSIKGKKRNPDVLPVWDVQKNGWRSFRLDSVLKVIDGENEYAYRG